MSQVNRNKRKAALAAVMQMGEGQVVPKKKQAIPSQTLEHLESAVESGYLAQTVGQLIEQARKTRGLGKRELARKLATTHGRVSKLEQSGNIELKSLLEVAQTLDYDLSISLIPKEGGASLGTVMKSGTNTAAPSVSGSGETEGFARVIQPHVRSERIGRGRQKKR
jgi:ribosome-binding protein aMBF1 (putative translation factor)